MFVSGHPIPSEANVAAAIFLLPLNSALNPFLYTFNVVREKTRARQEAKMLRQLEKQIIHRQINHWIQEGAISRNNLDVIGVDLG